MRRAAASTIVAALGLGALVLGVFGAGLTASTDSDIFWHLAAGKEIAARGALLTTDPFSLSAAGKRWIDVHWLFQLVAYGLHALGGLRALVLGKALLVSAAALLLADVVRQRAGAGALPFFAVCFGSVLLTVRELLLLRPTVFTLVMLAGFLVVLERTRSDQRAWRLALLPLLQVLWVNVQGLFALGPAVIGAYVLGFAAHARWGDRAWFPFRAEAGAPAVTRALLRPLVWSGVATAAACGVNPFGLAAIGLPAELLRRLIPGANVFSIHVAENLPPFQVEQQTGQFWHLKWFLVFLLLAWLAARGRWLLSQFLLVAGFLVLALMANRNVLLLYWVATPIAVIALYPRVLRYMARRRANRTFSRSLALVSSASVLALTGSVAANEPSFGSPAPFRVPELSARWIAEHGGQSRVFAADHFGGYLIWKLYPQHRPYLDTRLILRTEQQFAEFLGVVDDPTLFDEFAERHQFDYAVLPTAFPDRYLALLRHLYESSRWELVLTDGSETLFARRGRLAASGLEPLALQEPGVIEQIAASLAQRLPDARVNAAARVHLATLLLALGQPQQVEDVLQKLASAQSAALRARARLALGDSDGAASWALSVLRSQADPVRALNLLAVISLERGEFGKATTFLRRSLRTDPFDSESLTLLQNLEDHLDDGANP